MKTTQKVIKEMEKEFSERFEKKYRHARNPDASEHCQATCDVTHEYHYHSLSQDKQKLWILSYIHSYTRTLLANARREALNEMFLAIAELAEPDERQPSAGDLHTNLDDIHTIRERLATVRKEEKCN